MTQAIKNHQTQSISVGRHKSSRSEKRAAREILLLCATAIISQATKERLSHLLSNKVDWEHLLELAEFHGMMPLVFHNLTANGFISQIPKYCSAQLNKAYNGALFRNVYLSTELEKVLAAFREKKIDVIAIKGTVLAEQLYGNPGLRTVGDMDILVRPDSLLSAGSLLKDLGYEKILNKLPQGHPFHEIYQKLAVITLFIELHWNLDDRALVTVPLEDIWRRAETINIQGNTIMVLSPEDALVHLCNNLTKESERLLRHLCDITELVKKHRETLDWDYFIKSVRSWEIEAGVYYSLKHSVELLGAPVPVSVITALKPSLWRRWALGLLISRETLLLPFKLDQLRVETSNIVRCIAMKRTRHMLAVLSKYRSHRKRAAWLRTLLWIIFVFCASIGRNTVHAISRG